ncbi:LRR repeats and ubiquitin-like domain-containing protein [Hibiscus syriacus]|uniref:LRR repeats and ubiquitin-like domain-containing protein n=1 Tax=Hibiscus syriacus TaxID=106335 RepID=A0A6A3CI39_HIBSY|nr:LRR repeats and ubiquitin-like domain-containing protein [Hibiscus syriacus]
MFFLAAKSLFSEFGLFKGKLLVDAMTLKESEVMNGAKLMLMTSQGRTYSKRSSNSAYFKDEGTEYKRSDARTEIIMDKSRLERWKTTGVIALADYNLKTIPDEVWDCGSSARVLDVNNNSIQNVPNKISCLNSIQKLFLNANGISDEAIQWEGFTSLKFNSSIRHSKPLYYWHKIINTVNSMKLTTLPPALGFLTSLRQLNVANNKLTSLPNEIGLLTQLEVLKADNNRITTIPACIGECGSLVEVDLSENLLSELPDTFGNLHKLKALHLSNNGLKSLPCTLFKHCLQLSTLDLHNTEITMDVLRQLKGGKISMNAGDRSIRSSWIFELPLLHLTKALIKINPF